MLLAIAMVAVSGCSNIEPWVKPYERDRLADPIMALDTDPVSSAYIQHVYRPAKALVAVKALPVAAVAATRTIGISQ